MKRRRRLAQPAPDLEREAMAWNRKRMVSEPEMAFINGLDPAERALIHEYGVRAWQMACEARAANREAWLKAWRAARQRQLLGG